MLKKKNYMYKVCNINRTSVKFISKHLNIWFNDLSACITNSMSIQFSNIIFYTDDYFE